MDVNNPEKSRVQNIEKLAKFNLVNYSSMIMNFKVQPS